MNRRDDSSPDQYGQEHHEQRHYGPLREEISERLMRADGIDSSDVTVQVLEGKVVLEGTVPEYHMKYVIEELADAAPGVQEVDNRIRVQGS